jgi:hypothetical protein
MADATDIYGSAFKHGSATLLARIVGSRGANLVRADLRAAQYTVYLLDDQDADQRTPVAGHTDVSLAIADILFDSLQLDSLWNVDTLGYNFCHVLDVSVNQAFAIADRRYLVEYRLTPQSGQVIVVRFCVNVI